MKRLMLAALLAVLFSCSVFAQYYSVVPGVAVKPDGGTNYVFPGGAPFKASPDTVYAYPNAKYSISPLYGVSYPHDVIPLWQPNPPELPK
jgi:hypothetical protein